jgi:DMSO/TMAO reductase YedYZ heme-binding membrane subunit
MILWEVARASGLTALAVYTVVVAWGILLSGRALRPAAPQVGLHRLLGSIGLAAIAVHLACLLADRFAAVEPWTLLGIDARPGVVAGAVALWLVVLLPLTFHARSRRRLSNRRWRQLHYLGYAAWLAAVFHGLATGTSTGTAWATLGYAACASLVAGAAWWRWVVSRPAGRVAPTRSRG